MLGVEGDHALTGGAGSGMDADAVLQVRTQQAVGIGIPQIRLAEEGKFMDVIHTFNIIRRDAFLLHQMTVVGDIVPDMLNLPDDLLILDFQDLFARGGFNLRLIILLHGRSLLFCLLLTC